MIASPSNRPSTPPDDDPAIPRIDPVPPGVDRPTWSVMIPTYNPTGLFERALRSVLDQDPGPDRMQIAVVDDGSPDVDAGAVVRRLAPGRVEFHRNGRNLGLAGNWNAAIGMARGRWVHLFHQDDLILPGFYERLGRAEAEAPEAGAAHCQHLWVTGDDRWFLLSPLERPTAGLIEGWPGRLVSTQRVQFASVVVRRDVYERLGGFRTDLCMALDWEMWVRIACDVPWWYEPTMLAHYRIHDTSESQRLRKLGKAWSDVGDAIDLMKSRVPAELRDRVGAEMRPFLRQMLIQDSVELMSEEDYRGGMGRFREAWRHDPALRFNRLGRGFYRWAVKLWFREQVRRLRPRPPLSGSGAPRGPAEEDPRR